MKKFAFILVMFLTTIALSAGEPEFTMSGTISSRTTQQPVNKAKIECQQTGDSYTTEADGFYIIRCKTGVSNTITITSPQTSPFRTNLTPSESSGSNLNRDFSL